METNWDDFVDFYDWELSLLNKEQDNDKRMWLTLCKRYGKNVIEFGAGTGRISKFLAENGCVVKAIDKSETFISRMEVQQTNGLTSCVGDMLDYTDNRSYEFCIVTYTTFQYLLTREEQMKALNNMKNIIKSGGHIAFDLDPYICSIPIIQTEIKLYEEFHPKFECKVEMYTSHFVDSDTKITTWNDRYVIKNTEEKLFLHTLKLKEVTVNKMQDMLELCGFKIENIYGDFNLNLFTGSSDRLIIIAEKV